MNSDDHDRDAHPEGWVDQVPSRDRSHRLRDEHVLIYLVALPGVCLTALYYIRAMRRAFRNELWGFRQGSARRTWRRARRGDEPWNRQAKQPHWRSDHDMGDVCRSRCSSRSGCILCAFRSPKNTATRPSAHRGSSRSSQPPWLPPSLHSASYAPTALHGSARCSDSERHLSSGESR